MTLINSKLKEKNWPKSVHIDLISIIEIEIIKKVCIFVDVV